MSRITAIDLHTLGAVDALVRHSRAPTVGAVTTSLKANGEKHLRIGGVHMRILRLRDKSMVALERVRGHRSRVVVLTALGLRTLKEFHGIKHKGRGRT